MSYVKKFIAMAKNKHGDKYDYSKLNFVNTRTKVNIICPIHGLQSMYVFSHLNGTGCTMCGKEISGPKKLTTEEFIARARAAHGNLYDYSKVIYDGKNKNVDIICPKHGIFQQPPSNHTSGNACPKCRNEATRLTQEEFVSRANQVHNNKYNYGKTVYVNGESKVTITCPIHGDFEQIPFAHMYSKNGCPDCWEMRRGKSRKINLESFLSRAREIHGTTYDYSKVNLQNTLKKDVTIICKEHGEFQQTPDKHLQGNGCSKCTGKYQRNNEEYIRDAKLVHGDKFGYDRCNYINNRTPVTIKCPVHGYVDLNPRTHLYGSGCSKCIISIGEGKIEKWLKDNSIEYQREYRLPNSKWRYDFYIPKLNVLLEYDGIQHYKKIDHWGGLPHLLATRNRDKAKNELARIYNVPLIRIPYTKQSLLENFLLYKISKIYKYRKDNVFYKNFLELCRAHNMSGETTLSDVQQFLTYK